VSQRQLILTLLDAAAELACTLILPAVCSDAADTFRIWCSSRNLELRADAANGVYRRLWTELPSGTFISVAESLPRPR
jgi:hypothetical protein